ncbi:MAG: MaoC family dehydratase [Actinomycetota bacterium]
MQIIPAAKLRDRVGSETGVSEWLEIDQERINAFADATMDHQFIHIDPEAAAQTPFGSTIAHGFLTLSLTTPMLMESMVAPDRMVMVVNYGTDKVRFIEPVKVNSRIRGRTRLAEVTEKGPGRYLVKNEITVEIEGVDKPALIVEALTLFITA